MLNYQLQLQVGLLVFFFSVVNWEQRIAQVYFMWCLMLLPLWLLLSSSRSPAQCAYIHRDQFFHSMPKGAADTFSFASSGNSDAQCEIRHTQRTANNAISYWVLQAGHSLSTGPTYNTARAHINSAQTAKSTSSLPAGYGWSSSWKAHAATLPRSMRTIQIPWTSAGTVSSHSTPMPAHWPPPLSTCQLSQIDFYLKISTSTSQSQVTQATPTPR